MADEAIRVLVVDDDEQLRAVVEQWLVESPGIVVVGAAANAEEAIRLAADEKPHVALVDFHMPGGGERAVRGIREASPSTHVVAHSGDVAGEAAAAMLSAGAGSYLVKGSAAVDTVAAIQRAARGESILSAEVAGGVMRELASHLSNNRVEEAAAAAIADRTRRAIDSRGFFPVFQPVVDLATDRTVAYESLCRFTRSPSLPTPQWFRDADRVGLRQELELAAAAAAIDRFLAYGGSESLAVNASPDVLERVAKLGAWLGPRLIVEVTEHAAINDYEAVAEGLSRHRASGVRLAVDDAGAGFASFRHVLELKPDYIKLDASLVRNVDKDRARCALARGLISFGKELGIALVAEGVETPGELRVLRELGVDLVQGYLLGKPGPLPTA